MARNRIEFAVRVKDDASANLQRITKETDKLGASFKRLATTAISIGTIAEIARLGDTYRLLQNRLKLVTKDTEELRVVTKKLVEVSFASRSSFSATADLYARVARSSRTLGLSQQELIDFTETVSKSITISGSTAQEAAAGVIQFGQALASSRLSGDELRSVLEQMPRLAQAIAEGMDVGIGRLREMGEAGELTATRVLDALRKSAPAIAAEFEKLAPLLSQGFTLLESASMIAIGNLDAVTGSSEFLAVSLIDTAGGLIDFSEALTGTLEPGKEVSITLSRIAVGFIAVGVSVSTLVKGLLGPVVFAFSTIIEAGGALAAQLKAMADLDFDLAQTIGTEFTDRMVDRFTDQFVDLGKTLEIDMIDAMERAFQAMGRGRFVLPSVDLTFKLDVDQGLTKNQRTAMATANKSLETMQQTLFQQAQALNMARDSSLDYAEAMAVIKIRTLGLSADNVLLADNLIAVLAVQRDMRMEDADVKALDVMAQRLILIKQTAEQQAITNALDTLSAKASAESIRAMTENARELFRIQKELAEQLSFQENLAKSAAQNILDAFADFLFDPFSEGVKGMLKGFIDALRTMISQALAFKILSQVPGFAGFFAGTSRAAGGPVTAGQPVLVGERGPEIFVPGASGNIVNNSASKGFGGGSPQFITNIDARGADPGLIARLPAIMEQRDRKMMLMVKEFLDTGSVLI